MPTNNEQSKNTTNFYDPFTARSNKSSFDNLVIPDPWDSKRVSREEIREANKDSPP